MAEKGKKKITMMKLKVDLDCAKCYKKVKKVLCKIPQIRDQWFDEKSNIVIIKVVCCSPERIMDKLCSKGGGSIKTIEIIEQPKPPPTPPKPPPTPPVVPKQQGQPVAMCCWPYYDGCGGGPAFYGYGMLLPQPYEYYGRPVCDCWGGGPPPGYRPCHLTRCNFFSEENPQSCSIM
ncbi:BnaCnng77490D [Brassica napus]|uniref:(rape) hypothetical protein n=1 Tax=Brassica napus TaxID=3708 RepID=A0A078K0F3_BRANA|nr:protein PYRICULARIA ORYZAE RESISTANCE 21-like [Brassica napus]CAF2072969.1 unnamed protein product [Brassica napus]CDY72414.1 BnaCnng77490D [Brassica napus]